MTDIKTTGAPAAKKTGFVRVTKRQARFLAMTDVIMSLYEQLMRDYPECTTPSAIISRTVNESDDYEWLRAQYPDQFGGTIHRPDFVFFRCRTDSSR